MNSEHRIKRLGLVLGFAACFGAISLHAQTASDGCGYNAGNEYPVNTACAFNDFDKPSGFGATMNPGGCSSGNYDDAFGWFTATNDITLITYDPDNNDRAIMHVFTGACGSLTQVGCVDAGGNGNNAALTLATVPGTNYMVRIQLRNGNGAMNGRLCIWSPIATDACAFAATNQVSVGTGCSFQDLDKVAAYTATMNPAGCNGGNYGDAFVWFNATAPTTIITYDPDGSTRPVLHVFTGSCGSLTAAGCVDAGANGNNAELALTTVPGTNYLVRIQLYNGNGAMDGRICIWSPTTTDVCSYAAHSQIPVGNAACNTQPFAKPAAYTANLNPGTCGAGNYDDAYGWFTATATTTVITYQPPGGSNAILHVLTGACGSLSAAGCVNDGGNGVAETLVLTTTVGQNYLVRVQLSGSNNEMNGTICVHTPVTADECGSPIDLPVTADGAMQNFSNLLATRSANTPNPSCGGTVNNANTRDIWFRFTAPASGRVVINTGAGTMTNGVMQLYSGTCAALTAVECDDDDGDGNMPRIDRRCAPLTPGDIYWIRLFGNGGQQGGFGIGIQGWDTWSTPQEDCAGGHTVCSDESITNSTNYSGCTTDLAAGNRGCLAGNERQGSWYYFSPSASGTVAFDIVPAINDDYDFAIWGPLTTIACPPASGPVRCTWAYPPNVPGYPGAVAYHTGLRASSADVSENSGTSADGYVAPLTVIAGEIYVMYVDNYNTSGQAFTLDWGLTGGASLDCTVLPVELIGPEASITAGRASITWTTQSEHDSHRFIVERAGDDGDFSPIGQLPAQGHSVTRTDYRFEDGAPLPGVNHYRLRMVDIDGSEEFSPVATAVLHPDEQLRLWPNPAEGQVAVSFTARVPGVYIWTFCDLAGRVRLSGSATLDAGATMLKAPLDGLAPGIYQFTLHGPEGDAVGQQGRLMVR